MDVTFARTGPRRYGLHVEREGFPSAEMNPAPSYDADLPHDFVHFVVEQELGLERGVFGQLAAGGDAGTFRLTEDAPPSREAARARRRSRSRGERLGREGHADAELSERFATVCFHDWLAHAQDPARRARARELATHALKVRGELSEEERAALSEEALQRIRERLDELAERWSRVDVGEGVTLVWGKPRA